IAQTVQATYDGPLVQAQSEPVAELQTEGRHLVGEAKVRRGGPREGDLVGTDAGLHQVDSRVHPLAGPGVGIALGRGGTADRHRAVVAGPIAVVGVNDVKERLLAGANDAVRSEEHTSELQSLR